MIKTPNQRIFRSIRSDDSRNQVFRYSDFCVHFGKKCSVPFFQSLIRIQQIVTGRESDRKKSPKERDDRATITERLELKFRNLCTRVSVTGTMRGVARA